MLLIQRWPYDDAVLPTRELTRALIETSARLPLSPATHNLVIVLDADRAIPIARRPRDRRADNRYSLSAADFPRLADLRARGITRLQRLKRIERGDRSERG